MRSGSPDRPGAPEPDLPADPVELAAPPAAALVLLRLQSIYYGVTGAWPVVHMRSFEAVTGAKTDDWLVHMVGLLTVAVAVAIWPRHDAVAPAVRMLAILAAGSYLVIDVVYSVLGVISPVYLLDAAAEAGLIAGHVLLRPRPADVGV